MKGFFKRLVVFMLLPIAIGIAIYFLLGIKINAELADEIKNVRTIFVGDSKMQMAIDSKLVPNSINISREAESLNYSILKIKTLLEKPNSVRKIYLGMSYSTLTTCNETFIDGDFSTEIYARYFFILPLQDQFKLFRQNSGNIFSLTSAILTNGFKPFLTSEKDYSYFGSFHNDYKNTALDAKSADIKLSSQFYEDGKLRGFSKANIQYFNAIIGLCKSKNVELIILSTPLHPYYKSHVPIKFKSGFDALISKNNIGLTDLSNLISKDSLFASDGQHITQEAVALVSQQIK